MSPASLLRPLLVVLSVCVAGLAIAKTDATAKTGPAPVPYKREAHFSRRYDPNLKPDHIAVPLRPAPLVYPAKWRQWGKPAYAVVEFIIEDTGTPVEVQCSEATDRAFAKEAEKTIERSYFIPALKNQQGVRSKVTHRFEFIPETPETPAAPKPETPAQPATP